LADALRRDSVSSIYYPPLAIRELRELVRYRHAIVQTRTKLIQRLRAILLRQGIVEAHRLSRHDTALDTIVLPPQAAASVAGIRGLLAHVRAEAVAVDRVVKETAAADPVAVALQQIAGIGPVLALMIRAEAADISRFPTGGHLASYAGLVPRVEASAGRIRYGRITKRGSPWLRWALIQAAMQGPRRSDASGRWVRRLALRKGILKARVAAARQLCHEIHARWTAIA
jgi:transposase